MSNDPYSKLPGWEAEGDLDEYEPAFWSVPDVKLYESRARQLEYVEKREVPRGVAKRVAKRAA